jgi:hypothetical protein
MHLRWTKNLLPSGCLIPHGILLSRGTFLPATLTACTILTTGTIVMILPSSKSVWRSAGFDRPHSSNHPEPLPSTNSSLSLLLCQTISSGPIPLVSPHLFTQALSKVHSTFKPFTYPETSPFLNPPSSSSSFSILFVMSFHMLVVFRSAPLEI